MKQSILLFLSIFSISLFAQEGGWNYSYNSIFDETENNNQFNAIGGLTQIGGETYAGFRLRPELTIKKFGIGLDIPLMFNVDNGELRTEEFKNGSGPLRIIRYLRYGIKKEDPIYVRLGDISGTYLGYGGLVNNYSNSASFERRKIGLTWDILVKKKYGLEGFYSDINFTSPNLFGLRPYVKPLTDLDIPIIKTTEFGFTYVQDKDNTKSQYDENGNVTRPNLLDNTVRAWGLDVGFDIINTKILKLKTFAQYSKLAKNDAIEDVAGTEAYGAGHGRSVGALANFTIAGEFLQLNSRLERLWYSNNYLPQFFDAIYEINKDAKLASLITAERQQGIYGSLTGIFLSKIRVGGALLLPDEVNDNSPAYVRVDASLMDLFNKLTVTGTYMKGGITDMSDAFKIDERSLANARIAYKLTKIIVAGVDYRWTFTKKEDGDVEATSYVMPYFGLNVPLNMGSN